MADKDILEFVQSSKNVIDADSDDENEINNAAPVPTSSEMRNAVNSLSIYLKVHSNGEMNNKMDGIEQFVENLMLKKQCKEKYQCGESLESQSLKNSWNKLWPDLEGEKDFNDDRSEITDFVQSIPIFQECDEEDVETWMVCDAEDCGFLMQNDDEIVTSVQEESGPVDDENG
ncbi:hypothetical protein TNCV_1734481 [Trichonephila clavipes]|nr:hypothetical protein TNCV_1734481 [Trichonephila clavipes]